MTRIADISDRPLVWVEVKIRNSKRYVTQTKREQTLRVIWQRFIRWSCENDIEPVVRGDFGTHGWSDGYTKKDARRVTAWLNKQTELQD